MPKLIAKGAKIKEKSVKVRHKEATKKLRTRIPGDEISERERPIRVAGLLKEGGGTDDLQVIPEILGSHS